MKLSDFDFVLPPDLIAQHPVAPRDAARLLRITAGGLADHVVRDLPSLLRPGDLLVTNDTRVIKARLVGRRGDVRVEATLIHADDPVTWRAFARPGKRLKVGDAISFAADFCARVIAKHDAEVTLRFDCAPDAFFGLLDRHGAMPLPPYIKRAETDARDEADYQTVFAARPGAVAAPTASLHFTPELLAALAAKGIERTRVTLHVGAGTFLPVKTDDPREHVIHAEWGEITAAAAADINRARAEGRRLVAIGTTALRVVETVASDEGLSPWTGETRLFILPGHRFKAIDVLLTNFHLPKSTLFMLVSAFAGLDRMRAAYAHAVAARYRFFSYGDACLIDGVAR